MDEIKKFSKSKGYESLPRELLQSKEISLEAIGLMCNLQSYPNEWVLHKTELRKRFKNKEKVVDRIWDELVEHNYVLQFRKRSGKRYEYQYFFNVDKFSVDEIVELIESMYGKGMELYHKGMIGKDEYRIDDYIFADMGLLIWDSQNGKFKKGYENRNNWGSQNGKFNMEIPNEEGNRFNNKRFNTKREEDEYLKKDADQRLFGLMKRDKGSAATFKFLVKSGVSMDISRDIVLELNDRGWVINPKIIVGQLRWCMEKDDIGDFRKYFVEGVMRRDKWSDIGVFNGDMEEYYGNFTNTLGNDFKGIMHNWLEE